MLTQSSARRTAEADSARQFQELKTKFDEHAAEFLELQAKNTEHKSKNSLGEQQLQKLKEALEAEKNERKQLLSDIQDVDEENATISAKNHKTGLQIEKLKAGKFSPPI